MPRCTSARRRVSNARGPDAKHARPRGRVASTSVPSSSRTTAAAASPRPPTRDHAPDELTDVLRGRERTAPAQGARRGPPAHRRARGRTAPVDRRRARAAARRLQRRGDRHRAGPAATPTRPASGAKRARRRERARERRPSDAARQPAPTARRGRPPARRRRGTGRPGARPRPAPPRPPDDDERGAGRGRGRARGRPPRRGLSRRRASAPWPRRARPMASSASGVSHARASIRRTEATSAGATTAPAASTLSPAPRNRASPTSATREPAGSRRRIRRGPGRPRATVEGEVGAVGLGAGRLEDLAAAQHDVRPGAGLVARQRLVDGRVVARAGRPPPGRRARRAARRS